MSTTIKGIPIPSLNLIISNSFISQKQFSHTLNFNPSNHVHDDLPIHNISYYDIILFCNTLSTNKNLSHSYSLSHISYSPDKRIRSASISYNSHSNGYRLLNHKEYLDIASNFESTSKWSGTDDLNSLHLYAHFNSETPVKCYDLKPNALGFFHLSGNFKDTLQNNHVIGGSYLNSPDKSIFTLRDQPYNNSLITDRSFRIARPL